jgi:hypothetical protein
MAEERVRHGTRPVTQCNGSPYSKTLSAPRSCGTSSTSNPLPHALQTISSVLCNDSDENPFSIWATAFSWFVFTSPVSSLSGSDVERRRFNHEGTTVIESSHACHTMHHKTRMHASAQKMPTINRVVVDVHRKQLNMKARRKNPILVEKTLSAASSSQYPKVTDPCSRSACGRL